jgi:hypothetical protein
LVVYLLIKLPRKECVRSHHFFKVAHGQIKRVLQSLIIMIAEDEESPIVTFDRVAKRARHDEILHNEFVRASSVAEPPGDPGLGVRFDHPITELPGNHIPRRTVVFDPKMVEGRQGYG